MKNFRERSPLLVGAVSILALAAATALAFSIDRIPALKQAYEVRAEFADAAGLAADNQVRVAGIKVGTVSGIELAGDRVVVTMEIDNGTRIPAGAGAAIKLATILGTKYVDIEASGGAPFMTGGETIPLERTSVPYEIYQAANQGTGLLEDLDGEALNAMLVELTELTRAAEDEIGVALDGLARLGTGLAGKQEDLRSLLGQAGDLTRLLSGEGDHLVTLVDASNEVLGSLARKREELRSLLEATRSMAGTVTRVLRDNRTSVDRILDDLHAALVVLERNVEHVDVALRYAGDSSRYFGSLFIQGRWGDIYGCALLLSSSCESDG